MNGIGMSDKIGYDSPAAAILHRGAEIVDGSRQKTHGNRERTFGMIAALWSAYLGVNVTEVDAAQMMSLLKKARAKCGDQSEPDHYIDDAAYSALAGELASSGKVF